MGILGKGKRVSHLPPSPTPPSPPPLPPTSSDSGTASMNTRKPLNPKPHADERKGDSKIKKVSLSSSTSSPLLTSKSTSNKLGWRSLSGSKTSSSSHPPPPRTSSAPSSMQKVCPTAVAECIEFMKKSNSLCE